MTQFRLQSSGLVHTPGLIAWAINGYYFERDRPHLLKVLTESFPSVPDAALVSLLSRETPYTVEGEDVVFTWEAA